MLQHAGQWSFNCGQWHHSFQGSGTAQKPCIQWHYEVQITCLPKWKMLNWNLKCVIWCTWSTSKSNKAMWLWYGSATPATCDMSCCADWLNLIIKWWQNQKVKRESEHNPERIIPEQSHWECNAVLGHWHMMNELLKIEHSESSDLVSRTATECSAGSPLMDLELWICYEAFILVTFQVTVFQPFRVGPGQFLPRLQRMQTCTSLIQPAAPSCQWTH